MSLNPNEIVNNIFETLKHDKYVKSNLRNRNISLQFSHPKVIVSLFQYVIHRCKHLTLFVSKNRQIKKFSSYINQLWDQGQVHNF